MKFSHRTSWQLHPNRISSLLEQRRQKGQVVYDLTLSNPTISGIKYPSGVILEAISDKKSLHYQPDPRGLVTAREAVSAYYLSRKIAVDPSCIFLSASTSESYSNIFKLLCNPSQNILVPRPSYPLFDYLARINDVEVRHYSLVYERGWLVDLYSLKGAVTKSTKAIVLINPHNPTGVFIKKGEFQKIVRLAEEKKLAIVADEVFSDYFYAEDASRLTTTASNGAVLTFTMNGLSKMAGLPQMKLGWSVLSGPKSDLAKAAERLEIIADTFLSVNTPVQIALLKLMKAGVTIQRQILKRVKNNRIRLERTVNELPSCSLLASEGGWYAVLRVPRIKTDEEWSLGLLKETGVYVHPGYFFDFEEEGHLVISLLPEEKEFLAAVGKLKHYIGLTC